MVKHYIVKFSIRNNFNNRIMFSKEHYISLSYDEKTTSTNNIIIFLREKCAEFYPKLKQGDIKNKNNGYYIYVDEYTYISISFEEIEGSFSLCFFPPKNSYHKYYL